MLKVVIGKDSLPPLLHLVTDDLESVVVLDSRTFCDSRDRLTELVADQGKADHCFQVGQLDLCEISLREEMHGEDFE